MIEALLIYVAMLTPNLQGVNDFYNHGIMYETEIVDYWLTPTELRQRGKGDCEDFAIAKYFLLRDMGVHAEDLRIAYARMNDEAHMVLIYQPEQLVLDNSLDLILPLSRRKDLKIIYTFNENNLWYANQKLDAKLSKWRSLLMRKHEESG